MALDNDTDGPIANGSASKNGDHDSEAQVFLNGLISSIIPSLQRENMVFPPPEEFAKKAHIKSMDQYKTMYKQSIDDPEGFWKDIAKEFHFEESQPEGSPFLKCNFNIKNGPINIKWMEGSKTNICYNVLDRNVKDKGLKDTVAFFWEGNDPNDEKQITYGELLDEVCKFANVLKGFGVSKGDRVAIYMPMILELVVAMLAAARLGAIHSIVFGGFSAESLSERTLDAKAKVIVTADGVWRGDKIIHLKEITDKALEKCDEQGHKIEHCIVVHHLPRLAVHGKNQPEHESPNKRKQYDYKAPFNEERDKWYHLCMEKASSDCTPEWVDAEDPLFMLYTSGSTGKPKGVLHSTAGYMLYASTTFKYVFDYHRRSPTDQDIYFCTADVGWITGHTYVVYGPLANGATSVIFEGIPFYPDNSRFWAIVEKYKVNQFYTAPTAIRSLMKFGDKLVKKYDRSSLTVLGTVGEPINPEAWLWYYKVVGDSRPPVVDTYWQTEGGGHVLTPIPGATPLKPGSATFPFFGVLPAIVDENGKEIDGPGEGYLVFKTAWPGMMRSVYNDHDRFEATYFSKFPGYYFTGDGAKRDKDGYYWITGRVDDMLNVSGHLLSTAQVESALIEHKAIAESAVVPIFHDVKGEALYCFVTLRDGHDFTEQLQAELKQKVREKIGPFATPDVIQLAPALPKTRSGKIMRRILRKIAAGDSDLGDTSTLADTSVIQILLDNKPGANK
ncbi:acetyl-coenzyme A synthetase isoform X3 [Folsomia candida]|nr:acetyl-coenzyme A synthetase isoform X3 [Folsomia candida]XP_021957494.1 acetyl-coenzyme A synthetase isoform X3 [Folsomia candida]XP_021957500.1 acetyl-coenzyme A synthetase isoform X3 [Folsomia candida]XP_035712370.1 acetyl-coenzyme A synthetase isoform X3 [Folsomia candida]